MPMPASVPAALRPDRRPADAFTGRAPAAPNPRLRLLHGMAACCMILAIAWVPADAAVASDSPKAKKTSVKQSRSPAEESKAERDRRLYRECAGRPNAGACLGYTRKP